MLEYSLSLLHLPYAKFLDQERETDTELVSSGREEKEGERRRREGRKVGQGRGMRREDRMRERYEERG